MWFDCETVHGPILVNTPTGGIIKSSNSSIGNSDWHEKDINI